MTRQGTGYRGPGQPAINRRRLLRGAGVAGMSAAGAWLLACRSSTTTSGGSGSNSGSGSGSGGAPRSQATAQPAQNVNSLIGRGPAATEAPVMGGVYNQVLTATPPGIDPHKASSSLTMTAVSPVYSRLYRFKSVHDVAEANNRDIEPDVAASVETPDAQTWTFKLRQDVKFQNVAPVNGRPLEAEDVKASFVRALAPAAANRGQLLMIDPAQIETPDKSTVVFKLKYPHAPFQKLVASGVYGWILPREADNGYDPTKQMVGSGPFLFENFTPDVALTYKRNPDWFEKGKPYVDGIRLPIVPDAAQRLAQFTAGNVGHIGVPIDDVPTMKQQNPQAEELRNWDPGDGHIYYPLSDPQSPFKDIRVRQAVSLAIDRDTYGKVTLNGTWSPVFNVPLSFGKWALRQEDLSPEVAQWYKFDLQKAKQLLEAAGAANLSLKMIYPTPNPREPWFRTVVELVVNMLNKLPWKVQIVNIDYNKDFMAGGKGVRYGNNIPSDGMVWWGLEGRSDPDEYLYGFWHSQSTTSTSKLNDPKLDGMLDKARATRDEAARVKAYIDLQKYIAEQVYSSAGNPSGLSYTLVQPWARNYTTGDSYGAGTSALAKVWIKK